MSIFFCLFVWEFTWYIDIPNNNFLYRISDFISFVYVIIGKRNIPCYPSLLSISGGKKIRPNDKKEKKRFLVKRSPIQIVPCVLVFFFYFVCSCMYVYNIQVQMIDFEMEINQIYRTKSFCLCVCVWLYCFVVVVIQFILSHLWFSFFSSIDWFYFLVCEQKKFIGFKSNQIEKVYWWWKSKTYKYQTYV